MRVRSQKNHCNFHIETATFEHRHENKSRSACPKDHFQSSVSFQVFKVFNNIQTLEFPSPVAEFQCSTNQGPWNVPRHQLLPRPPGLALGPFTVTSITFSLVRLLLHPSFPAPSRQVLQRVLLLSSHLLPPARGPCQWRDYLHREALRGQHSSEQLQQRFCPHRRTDN